MRPVTRLLPGVVVPLIALVALVALLASACGGSGGGQKGLSNGSVHATTAAAISAQLSQRSIGVSGAIHCNGRAPGVIDCIGRTTDGKTISATLTAATNGTNCRGPLVIAVASNEVASVASAKCS
jgi:hypothetical protein